MEPWTFQGNNFQFHLRCRMEVGRSPRTTPPMLHLCFNFGSSRRCFLPPFWRVLEDPDGWQREVQHMIITVLLFRDGGTLDESLLADAFCRYFDAALRRFPALYGTAMVINAHIDTTPRLPTPPPTVDDVMRVAEQRPYYGGRALLVPALEFEDEFVDDVMMLSPVEDLARGGGGSGDTPASSASALLESLEIVTFGEAEAENMDADDTCSICLDDFEPAQQLYLMPCHHRFHMRCLKKWLARSHACPLCRFDLFALQAGSV